MVALACDRLSITRSESDDLVVETYSIVRNIKLQGDWVGTPEGQQMINDLTADILKLEPTAIIDEKDNSVAFSFNRNTIPEVTAAKDSFIDELTTASQETIAYSQSRSKG